MPAISTKLALCQRAARDPQIEKGLELAISFRPFSVVLVGAMGTGAVRVWGYSRAFKRKPPAPAASAVCFVMLLTGVGILSRWLQFRYHPDR